MSAPVRRGLAPLRMCDLLPHLKAIGDDDHLESQLKNETDSEDERTGRSDDCPERSRDSGLGHSLTNSFAPVFRVPMHSYRKRNTPLRSSTKKTHLKDKTKRNVVKCSLFTNNENDLIRENIRDLPQKNLTNPEIKIENANTPHEKYQYFHSESKQNPSNKDLPKYSTLPSNEVSSHLKEFKEMNTTPCTPLEKSCFKKYETPINLYKYSESKTPLFSTKKNNSYVEHGNTSYSLLNSEKENHPPLTKHSYTANSLLISQQNELLNCKIETLVENNTISSKNDNSFKYLQKPMYSFQENLSEVHEISHSEIENVSINKNSSRVDQCVEHFPKNEEINIHHISDIYKPGILCDISEEKLSDNLKSLNTNFINSHVPLHDSEINIQSKNKMVNPNKSEISEQKNCENIKPSNINSVQIISQDVSCKVANNTQPNITEAKTINNSISIHQNNSKICAVNSDFVDINELSQPSMKQFEILTVKGKQYTILGKLGIGGSSEVLKVLDTKTSLMFAIKCVDLAVDVPTAESYINEIKLLQRLQGSDRVITMYDFEYDKIKKKLYVVLEMGDVDLSSLLKSYKAQNQILPFPILIGYWTEMLTAVNHIHKNGIIHSDLKPANFLLVHGRLKLIDFGIASTLNADATSVLKDFTTGTFNYISPEAITLNSNNAKISYKSDVWSLGCILYSMLYGHTPFGHIKSYAKIAALCDPNQRIDYPPLKDVPPVLMKALKWCLTFDVRRRPSVQDLIDLPYLNSFKENIPFTIVVKIKSVLSESEWQIISEYLNAGQI